MRRQEARAAMHGLAESGPRSAAPPDAPALPPAVVLNLHESGVGIARALARRGVRVIGLSADPHAPGTRTRHAEVRAAPDSATRPAALFACLSALGAELAPQAAEPPVLFPTNDADLAFLDSYRDGLSPWFTLAVPPPDLLAAFIDKAELSRLAAQHGLSVPVIRRVDDTAALDALAGELAYPAVIKPVATTAWRTPDFRARVGARKGWHVRDHDECRRVYRKIAAVAPAALIQEWVGGPEDAYIVVGAALGAGGRPLGAFTGRKLMQYPPGIGLGCLLESSRHDALRDRTLAFLQAVGFRGVCEVEFKADPGGAAPRLIEINPRHWDQHALGGALGVDLPWLAYRDLIGLPAGDFAAAQGRRTWVRGPGVTGSVKDALRRRDPAVLRPLWRTLGARRCYAFWDSDDPGPFLQALRNRLPRRRSH